MPTARRHHRRSLGALTAAAATATLLSGCTPASESLPTPTPLFATEQEAYAAAEETYRAYLDGIQARIDGQERPDPRGLLIGSALDADTATQRSFKEHDIRIDSSGSVAHFEGVTFSVENQTAKVRAAICLDARDVHVLDSAGNDVTPPSRGAFVGLDVTFVQLQSRLVITDSTANDSSACKGK